MIPLFDSVWHEVGPCSDDTATCRKNTSKGQGFFEWANRIDRNHDDVDFGSGDQEYVALYLGYVGRILQVQLLGKLLVVIPCRENKRKGLAFFVSNRIDRSFD